MVAPLIAGILGLLRLRRPLLIAFQPLLPLYWILTSIATWRAAWQLAVDPFKWEKTTHGKTRIRRNLTVPIEDDGMLLKYAKRIGLFNNVGN